MAAIYALPEELLAHVMLLCADLPAQQKMALSHICRRWRYTAIRTSLFWATIIAHDVRDLKALDTLLERSGSAALHVHIAEAIDDADGDDRTADNDWDQCWIDDLLGQQLDRLENHISRLQTLELHFGITVSWMKFLRSGLCLPVLETLVIDASWIKVKGYKTLFFNFLSPALRVLKLTQVQPLEGWNDLLQRLPLLEHLFLKVYVLPNSGELHAALGVCRQLRELSLCGFSVRPGKFVAPVHGWNASSSLRALSLRLHTVDMAEILEGISAIFIPSITLITARKARPVEFPDDPVVEHFMRDIGRVVAFDVFDGQNVLLRDDKGNERCLVLEDQSMGTSCITSFWEYLCKRHSAASTVTSFTLTSDNWLEYSEVFSEISPTAAVELRLTGSLWHQGDSRHPPTFLIDSNGRVFGGEGFGSDLWCYGARRVCFETAGAEPSDLAPLYAVLKHVRSLSCVELCLGLAEAQSDQKWWLDGTTGLLYNLNIDHDNDWTLCALCTNVAH